MTLTESNLELNIESNFADPGITQVVIVSENRKNTDALVRKTMELRAKFGEKLLFKPIFAFTDKEKSWEEF